MSDLSQEVRDPQRRAEWLKEAEKSEAESRARALRCERQDRLAVATLFESKANALARLAAALGEIDRLSGLISEASEMLEDEAQLLDTNGRMSVAQRVREVRDVLSGTAA